MYLVFGGKCMGLLMTSLQTSWTYLVTATPSPHECSKLKPVNPFRVTNALRKWLSCFIFGLFSPLAKGVVSPESLPDGFVEPPVGGVWSGDGVFVCRGQIALALAPVHVHVKGKE